MVFFTQCYWHFVLYVLGCLSVLEPPIYKFQNVIYLQNEINQLCTVCNIKYYVNNLKYSVYVDEAVKYCL